MNGVVDAFVRTELVHANNVLLNGNMYLLLVILLIKRGRQWTVSSSAPPALTTNCARRYGIGNKRRAEPCRTFVRDGQRLCLPDMLAPNPSL